MIPFDLPAQGVVVDDPLGVGDGLDGQRGQQHPLDRLSPVRRRRLGYRDGVNRNRLQIGRMDALLGGTQLAVVPTNEPVAARDVAEMLTRARAFENHMFYLWVNRVGSERGINFMGSSTLVDPEGHVIFKLSEHKKETAFADLDLKLSDSKHLIREPGRYEIDLLKDRRPRFYGELSNES